MRIHAVWTAALALVGGCGGSDSNARASDGSGITASDATETSEPDDGTAEGTGGPGSGMGSQSGGTAGSDDDSDSQSGGTPKYDVGSPDGGASCASGDGGGGSGTFSYIWIANSGQGTVSKINTETLVEEGRYLVRADAAGSPSRTSVNLNGDVGVANRLGGVTKIWANPSDCSESNGTPGIQSSTGAADVLAWGEEECVAWHTPLACTSNRPMAWTQGEFSTSSCQYENTKLWTECTNGNPEVILLDGDTGAIDASVVIPEFNTLIYGGAVDGNGDFWGLVSGGSNLVRVHQNDMSYDIYPPPANYGYGIAVDADGRPWFCGGGGASRFDIMTQTWTTFAGAGIGIGGCMTDGQGTLWHSRYPEGVLVAIDTDSVTQVGEFPIPAYVHGVSVDFNGYVWGVEFSGTRAFRLDPDTGQVDIYDGLTAAYTYSDMTGFGLSSAGTPSG
jgi:streptogramin lyase